LNTALWFAVKNRDSSGRRWLEAHPLPDVRISKSVTPNRPVAREKDYLALRTVAAEIDPLFETALDLAHATGHRIDSILHLRWSDLQLEGTEEMPFGWVRWRLEDDKIDNEHTTPLNELGQAALLKRRSSDSVGQDGLVFPSPANAEIPFDRRLMGRRFRKAEKLAGITHQRGRGFHAFRRGWASSRMTLPDVAVAAAGGWKDTKTMKQAYQHPTTSDLVRAVRNTIAV
jgi:integrase